MWLPVQAGGADLNLTERAEAMRVWTVADGLPSDSVTAILQSQDGFLWVGTSTGLVRFDGAKFTRLKLNGAGKQRVHVTALCQDNAGDLWIGTMAAGLFELRKGKVRHFTKPQGLLDNQITSLASGKQGSVWIGSPEGLNRWVGGHFKSFTTQDGLPDKYVSGVNVARSGTVWITTRVGMCRFIHGQIQRYRFRTESRGRSPQYLGMYEDRNGNLWAFGDTYLINLSENKRLNYFRSSKSASVRIWSLCEGRDGRLWIGTSGGGLFCFEGNRFRPVILGENRRPYDVRALCEDQEGNLWLGTSGGGLIQLRPQSVRILRASQGLPTGSATALAAGPNGRIYVALQHGGLFAGEAGRFDHFGTESGGMREYLISSVCAVSNGTVWVGTFGNGLFGLRSGRSIHFTTADGLADDTVLAVCADAQGNIWISTGAGLLTRLKPDNHLSDFGKHQGLPGTPVTAMIPAATNGLWLGTDDGQILRERAGNFRSIRTAKMAGGHPVLALHAGKRGRLWIGTDGGGLSCLVDGIGMNWNTTNGLPNDIVAGVVEDHAGNLWLATGAGIYRVNHNDVSRALAHPRDRLPCQWISDARSLPDSTTVAGGTRAVLAPDGNLWFATSKGLLNVDAHASEILPARFPVYLENAVFNGQPPVSLLGGALWKAAVKGHKRFRAPTDVRSLEVHFTALDFTTPDELQFRHQLEGFDPEWVEDGANRSARYGHLPYGHYRFRVAVRNGDGKWRTASETFAFVVPTPVYLQWWAIGLYGLAAIALIAGIVRMVSHRRLRAALVRLEQQQALERERMRIARDMHDEMGSKLTKISFLSEHAQVDARSSGPLARKIGTIAETSQELLKTMDEIVWVVNPHNDTLENLTAYLSGYAVEYFQNTRVECELQLPQEIPHCPLASDTRHNVFLTFEEALNNVLKHSGATKIKVRMAVSAGEFEVVVTDNGKGFEVPAEANQPVRSGRGGNGLKNMRQRLAAVGGDCQIVSRPGAGTTVRLCIPLKKTDA